MPDRAEGGYEQFFGLKEPPFSLAPDPRFLFASVSHSAALAQVAHAIDRREPIVVVTGEIGTGKTLLCRTVLRRLPRKTFVSVVNDPLLGPDDLLKQLLEDFGVISRDRAPVADASRHELVQALHAFLRSLAALQAHAVVIIDEAQHLQPAVLEQIRLLSNVDDERGTLLQIVLVGQTDMEPLLSRPDLRQIRQRVSRRFRLERLTGEEVQQYIEHRLARAREGAPVSQVPGASELARALVEWEGDKPFVEFDPGAVEAISRLTGGLPRVINLICDRALEQACASGMRVVDAGTVHTAARELGIDGTSSASVDPAVAETRRDEAAPAAFGLGTQTSPARRTKPLVLAATALAIAAAATWVGYRASSLRSRGTPVSAPAATSSPAVQSPPTPAPLPSTAAPSNRNGSPSTGAPAPPTPAPPVPSIAALGSFEILVASFRTEPRATSVEAEVARLGLSTRRRVQGGWQQVICGPFASRDDAEAARQRLARAGFTGTQIVVSIPD